MGQSPGVYNLQSESQENSQQFNVRSSWQSQVPTGQPPRQLWRSYWVSLLFIYDYKEKLVAQHSTDLDFLFLQTSVISIPVKLKKSYRMVSTPIGTSKSNSNFPG
ncbi:hypothetical protein AVEN_116703-1 [Araneus ventricosus]|uniref:Uncharacterized protein n=1 Tax=Araneus ventricosus TaxID=182803 RepID=A0A4Y2EK60_ARAVE|nr:hypothetical protein AVEN_116703-1 [Araneus ventricosus]